MQYNDAGEAGRTVLECEGKCWFYILVPASSLKARRPMRRQLQVVFFYLPERKVAISMQTPTVEEEMKAGRRGSDQLNMLFNMDATSC